MPREGTGLCAERVARKLTKFYTWALAGSSLMPSQLFLLILSLVATCN